MALSDLRMKIVSRVLLSFGWGASSLGLLAADKPAEPVVTAVFSNVFNNYQRTRLPDGKFKPELYTFGDGGRRNASLRDPTIDDLS
jgi:hypothetical protein